MAEELPPKGESHLPSPLSSGRLLATLSSQPELG